MEKKQLFSRIQERNTKRTAHDAPTDSILNECPSLGEGGDSPSHAHGTNLGLQFPRPHCQPALFQIVPTRPASSPDWEETTIAYRLSVLYDSAYSNVRKGKLSSGELNIMPKVPQLIYDRARL